MPQFFQTTNYIQHNWANVTQAVWQKYPNPFASHVLSSDVVERRVDPVTGVMSTTRLFLKKGAIPKWGRSLFNVRDAFILETSTVDPRTQTMTTVTRNLSHKKIMLVEETQTYTPRIDDPINCTQLRTNVRIISNTGWAPIKSRIEGFGLSKFKDNTIRSSKGLMHVLERLKHHQGEVMR
ncbi:PRELI-like family-domain-containing protein [Fimicolochytrium jonesii]|uniref:PRELI-like family-domain-containing protein n=1 Tax=Fimicolochytrium jonesii TaxID=1396493 RepID=UPI0022FED1E9|nr:PRELI-like family-domain-containing protein [Fimicolochytrium jonesii]KAI8826248.1 PRELI-like family-domain-containing protein [Fimicolochytrium jonesii]